MDNVVDLFNELRLGRMGVTAANFPHSSEWLAGVNGTREWNIVDPGYYGYSRRIYFRLDA